MFDPQKIRGDFPILSKLIHGKPLVYLDSAATSHKPRQVIEAITEYYELHNANVHRGVHQLGDESTTLFHQSRHAIANFLGANPQELIVTRNTTEALNLIAYTWGEQHVSQGDVIITTQMEHHSNIVPWQQLAQRRGARVEYVEVNSEGELELDSLVRILETHKNRVKIVAFTHVSNTLGTLNPVSTIVDVIKTHYSSAHRPLTVVDGAQAAPHLPVNFHQLGVDCYAVSAHKMLGPMGIGGLLVRQELLAQWPPFLYGGGMINEVTQEQTTFADDLEERFTAGTPDVASLVGWAAACEYLQQLGMAQLLAHDQKLVRYTLDQLASFKQLHLIGPQPSGHQEVGRVGSVAFVYGGVHAHDVGQILDSEGVAVRSGHHCTMPLHLKFEWPATTRVSFQAYTTLDDIDTFIQALHKVQRVFGT